MIIIVIYQVKYKFSQKHIGMSLKEVGPLCPLYGLYWKPCSVFMSLRTSIVCTEMNLSSENYLLYKCLHWRSHVVFGVYPSIKQGSRNKINWVLKNIPTVFKLGNMTVFIWEIFVSRLKVIFTNCFYFLLGSGPCCLRSWLSAAEILKTLSEHPLYLTALSLHSLLPGPHTRGDSSKAPGTRVSF